MYNCIVFVKNGHWPQARLVGNALTGVDELAMARRTKAEADETRTKLLGLPTPLFRYFHSQTHAGNASPVGCVVSAVGIWLTFAVKVGDYAQFLRIGKHDAIWNKRTLGLWYHQDFRVTSNGVANRRPATG